MIYDYDINQISQRGEEAELIYESSSPINAVELDKTRRMMLICAGAYVNVMEQQEGINSTGTFIPISTYNRSHLDNTESHKLHWT